MAVTTHALFGLCSNFVTGRSSLQRILDEHGEYSASRAEQIAACIEDVARAFVERNPTQGVTPARMQDRFR